MENQNPVAGNFIFGKKIINNGRIISLGKRPVNVIQTEDYSGNGVIKTEQSNIEEKIYQKWWFKFTLTIIGGLIVGYLIFKLGWNK